MAIEGDPADVARTAAPDRQYLSPWLWAAVAGAVLQLMGLGSNFYSVVEDGVTDIKDAWLGIPHTSDLMLVTALVAIALFALTAANRSPLGGRGTGLWIGILGLLSTLQLGYRMIAPPFAVNAEGDQTLANLFSGDCQFYCSPSAADAVSTELLTGIWFGFVGCILVAIAGLAHAASGHAKSSPARPWVAAEQSGRTPWLALAGIMAPASFVIGYTVFPFYHTRPETGGTVSWSGWLPSPHTSSLVLVLAIAATWLVVLAARGRSPLSPGALGSTLAMIGFIISSRILLRILQPPFSKGAEIQFPAYVALGAGILLIVAGIAHSVAVRRTATSETSVRQ